MSKILVALALVLIAERVPAGDAPWVRGYGEGFSRHAVLAKGGSALVATEYELIRIDEGGVPQKTRKLQKPRNLTTVTASGEVFNSRFSKNDLPIEKFSKDLEPMFGRVFTFPESVMVGGMAGAMDGGVFIAANEPLASIVMRLDRDGVRVWSVRLDPSGHEDLNGIVATRDGGCVVVGARTRNAWIVKLDKSGRVQWNHTYAYADGGFQGVLETDSGEIVATGQLDGKLAVVRLTSAGDPIWQKLYSGAGLGIAIAQTDKGSFVVAGTGVRDWKQFVVVELKSDGTSGWKRRFDAASNWTLNLVNTSVVAALGSSVLVAVPRGERDRRIIVTALDAATGASSCEWWSDVGGEWVEGKIAEEDIAFESFFFTPAVADLTIESREWSRESTAEGCSGATEKPANVETVPTIKLDPNSREASLKERYRALVREAKYDELESEAERLRREKPFENPLWWNIDVFYDAIVSVPGTNEDQRLQSMRDWIAARPASITAKVALAKVLTRAAGQRRGPGYSDTVTDLAWQQYSELMKEAQRVFESIGPDGEADPQYWMMRITFENEFSDGDIRETVRQAAKRHQYPSIFLTASLYLHPDYGGTPMEYLAFADEAAGLTATTFGDGLYAAMVYYVRRDDDFKTHYQGRIDWKRVVKGYRDFIKVAPSHVPSYHALVSTARLLNDRHLARELFARPELGWYPEATRIWDSRTRYEAVRKWALSEPVESFLETPSSTWPQIMMQGRLVLTNGAHDRMGAFLIETDSGVAAVSVVPENADRNLSAVSEARRHLKGWTLWLPGQPRSRFEVSMVSEGAEKFVRATLLSFSGTKKAAAKALKPRSVRDAAEANRLSARRFIVGCTWKGETCVQTVIEGESSGGMADPSGSLQIHDIKVREPIPSGAFVGGPVLDEDGRVVAVVRSHTPSAVPGVVTSVSADDLAMVIAASKPTVQPPATAGATAAPPPAALPSVLKKPSASSFPSLPFAKWPAIVMQNEIVLTSGTFKEIGSFLVKTPTGIVSVAVVPEKWDYKTDDGPIRTTWAKLSTWTMWSPAKPKQILTVGSLETRNPRKRQRGIAVALLDSGRSLPVLPLVQRTKELSLRTSGSCFVVGCLWSKGNCVQAVTAVKLIGSGGEKAGDIATLQVALPESMEPNAFVGGALVDDEGNVLGVVTGNSDSRNSQYPYILDVDAMGIVLSARP